MNIGQTVIAVGGKLRQGHRRFPQGRGFLWRFVPESGRYPPEQPADLFDKHGIPPAVGGRIGDDGVRARPVRRHGRHGSFNVQPVTRPHGSHPFQGFAVMHLREQGLLGEARIAPMFLPPFRKAPGQGHGQHGGSDDAFRTCVIQMPGIVVVDSRGIIHALPRGDLQIKRPAGGPHIFGTDFHRHLPSRRYTALRPTL